MTEQQSNTNARTVQLAADDLVSCEDKDKPAALLKFAGEVLEHYSCPAQSGDYLGLFSADLPRDVQRFTAAWLLRILAQSPMALNFDDVQRLTVSLFDRVIPQDIYSRCGLDTRSQTFEKLQMLTDYMQQKLSHIEAITSNVRDLHSISGIQHEMLRAFNDKTNRPLLLPLLPRSLITTNQIRNLFAAANDYMECRDSDPLPLHNAACEAFEEYARQARDYGTEDADAILGGLARQLRDAVKSHFESLESNQVPCLDLSPIAKKYPLALPGTIVPLKVRITNSGTGSARNLQIELVDSDATVTVQRDLVVLGTLGPGDSLVFDLMAEVVTECEQADFWVRLSWLRLGREESEDYEFTVAAQREGIDWDEVIYTEPYSLEAVTSGAELVGRELELIQLRRLVTQKDVGSGFIFGQKRVGKTSLANVLAMQLEADSEAHWIVISKGSGDYVSSTASSTIKNLGEVLVDAIRLRLPEIRSVSMPDFSHGLAPLSGLIDYVLQMCSCRLLFVLDEFDELPLDLLRRTDLSTSLFQPLRQISNKSGCGVILVGGEGMQQIKNLQGDRLNKFRPVQVDYFDRSQNWTDFLNLIRRPVEEWLTISDIALDRLFQASAGNPYFAKLIANQLFSDLVEHHHSDASELDMDAAIDNTVNALSSNSFAHFWTDGLVDHTGDADTQRTVRRHVLIGIGRAFRRADWVTETMIAEELAVGSSGLITLQTMRSAIREFQSRNVLIEDDNAKYQAKVPLFQSWLVDKGVSELIEDSREIDLLKTASLADEETRVKDQEVVDLVAKLDHFRYRGRGIDASSIRAWLDQFDGLHAQRLMFTLLSATRVLDEHQLRAKTREAFGILSRNIPKHSRSSARVRRDIVVSCLDESAAKAGLSYCRLFAGENQISAERVMPIDSIQRKRRPFEGVKCLVLVDDFAGTGTTIERSLQREADFLRCANEAGVSVVVFVLVGFASARSRIERTVARLRLDCSVYFCEELGSEHMVFSERSTVFTDRRYRESAREIAEAAGVKLESRMPLGYGGMQSLVVFYQSCPNNSLPILWSQGNGWRPLFPRL